MERDAVATMVFRGTTGGHEVLLLRRATRPFQGEWFPVEGSIDPGETAEEAVVRELHEETRLEPLAVYFESTRVVPSDGYEVRLHIYVTFVAQDGVVTLNEEHIAFQWCSIKEASRLLPLPAQQAALDRIQARFIDNVPPSEPRIR